MIKLKTKILMMLIAFLFIGGSQFVISQTKFKKEELININSGIRITEIISNYGEPDDIETYGSNYRHFTYKIKSDISYILSFLPNGKLFRLSINSEKDNQIVFFDEQYETLPTDTRNKLIFYTPLGLKKTDIIERLGSPDFTDESSNIFIYKLSDSIYYKLCFTEDGVLWKVQHLKDNKEIVSRFDIRILDNEK